MIVIATSSMRNYRSSGLETTKKREKRSISRMKEFYRNPLVGNLENLAKNMQVGILCHINLKKSQEIGNRQTDKQTDKVL